MMKVTRIEEVIVKQILLPSIIANVKRTVERISILTLSPWKVCFYFNPCSSSLTLHSVCIISNNSSLVSESPFHDPFPNLNPNPHPSFLPLTVCSFSLRGRERGIGLVLSIVVVVTKLGAVSKCDFFILCCKLVVRGGFVSGEVPLYRGTMKVIPLKPHAISIISLHPLSGAKSQESRNWFSRGNCPDLRQIITIVKRKCMESSEDNSGVTYEAWRIIIQESEMGLIWMILTLLLCIHTSYRFYFFFFSQLCICAKERCKISPDWN